MILSLLINALFVGSLGSSAGRRSNCKGCAFLLLAALRQPFRDMKGTPEDQWD